jgi:hypothetical protein
MKTTHVPFSFNPDRHNFWPIYETIVKYYPIGISKESPLYFRYPGIKALEEIVVRNIHDKHTYDTVWTSFTKSIQQVLGKEVIGTTYGQSPSFSAFLKVDSWAKDQITIRKELHFTNSLIGPFFTIFGQEVARFKELDGTGDYPSMYESTIVLTVSPFEEYEELFVELKKSIESRFDGYKFVPFAMNQDYVEGLSVGYIDQKVNTIYHALFNHLLFADDNPKSIRGDQYYGYEAWKIDSPAPEGWIILPPGANLEEIRKANEEE